MKLFLDSANIEDVKEAMRMGVIQGVTTNPSLMAKEPKEDYLKHINAIRNLTYPLPLSVEVFETEQDAMIAQGRELFGCFSRCVVKIPVGWEELYVIRALVAAGVDVNCTCVFSESQAILGLNAGSRYVSFFTNRMLDRGIDAYWEIGNVRKLMDKNARYAKQEIICGSIRRPQDVVNCFRAGAHIVTASLDIIKQMAYHEGTVESVSGFLEDFKEWRS